MINTLIFDFGDVFINLDKEGAMKNALNLFKVESFENDILQTNINYETGKISTPQFINFYLSKFPFLNKEDIIDAWNYILTDFPKHRFDFVNKLSSDSNYNLILLSNTNELHINHIEQHLGFFYDFKDCFNEFYLSHEIEIRKPDREIFEYVLKKNYLKPNECLFIDDTKENTDTAESMGFHIWNIDENTEDIVNLFEVKKELF